MTDNKELTELIESFIEYRNLLLPLQENLRKVADSYKSIKDDLSDIEKNLGNNVSLQLDKIHSALSVQAKGGKELTDKIASYAESGDKFAKSVSALNESFSAVTEKLETVTEIEKSAESLIARLDGIINEKRANYNLKDLQKSLDTYNKNVEKISEFINKDVASVMQENARKIEELRKQNELLSAAVDKQGESVAELTAVYSATSSLLRKTVESGSVNEEYLFDAFDKWAADRKVKVKKK